MDAVITYVNSEDKTWREEYKKHVKSIIEEARYRDCGTLQYVIKGIRQFMPFIEHIYLVVSTPSQITGIDVSEVNVVYHKDIIPEKYLPTFNSCTIEMFLHKIPGLSEEFIYFNDDTFVIKPMKKTDFFIDGKPVLNPHLQKCSQFDINSIFVQQCKNSTELIRSKFVKKYPVNVFIRQEHIMRPMLKSTYEVVWETCEKEIINSLTRIRTKRNYNAYLFNNYDVMTGYYVQKELPYKYIKTSDSINSIISDIASDKFSVVCVNDSGAVCKNDKDAINGAFENVITKKEPNNVKQKSLVLKDKLYVSFTSWEKRINNCKHTVDLMSKQTLKPTKIILNLAEEEFPNKENDLPQDLVAEAKNNPLFEIYWVKENTTVWKKILPTMNRFPDDLVLSIDDDIEYPDNYIEEMYRTYCEYNKLYPIVSYGRGSIGVFSHSGPFTLTSKKFFGDYLDDIYINLIQATLNTCKWQSDTVYTYCTLLNKCRYKRCYSIDGENLYKISVANKINAYSSYNTGDFHSFNNTLNLNKQLLDNYVEHKYGVKNLLQNCKYECIISLTSWKGRINNVYKTINNLLLLSDNRFKVVLTLSSDEFEKSDLPENLTSLLCDRFEILWVKKNYKVFKKMLFAMQKYNMCPIISVDDDCLYKYDFMSELLDCWYEHKNDITTLLRENKWTINDKSYLFAHGCATIYPPSSMFGALKYIDNDKILSTNNDDSFLGIYATINNIHINYLGYKITDVINFHTNEGALTYNIGNQMDKFLNDKKIIINELCKK